MEKLYCTICSKDKKTDKLLLPAKERYISERIDLVNELSKKDNVAFVILSGEFGLLKPNENIPFYDHLLIPEEVATLTKKVTRQLSELSVDEIVFFAKPKKDNWVPYYQVLENATNKLKIKLAVKDVGSL
jgi:hypothetical protein